MSEPTIVLRGQRIYITNIVIARADRSVGIMNDYCEDFRLKDIDGKELDWDLTEEEINQICDVVNEYRTDDWDADI